jgi:hypothetical protein
MLEVLDFQPEVAAGYNSPRLFRSTQKFHLPQTAVHALLSLASSPLPSPPLTY